MTIGIYQINPEGCYFLRSVANLILLLGSEYKKFSGEKNIYYSVCEQINLPSSSKYSKCDKSNFHSTNYIWFDFDGVSDFGNDIKFVAGKIDDFIVQNFGDAHRYYINSGHGIHLLIEVPIIIKHKWITDAKPQYNKICQNIIEYLLSVHDIEIKCIDTAVFEGSRLLRVPGTINAKPDKQPVECYLIEELGTGESKLLKEYLETPIKTEKTDLKYKYSIPSIELFVKELEKFTKLEKKGKYYRLCCPFHPEKTPSFIIYEDGKGFGNDFHHSIKEKGFSRDAFSIWSQLKYGKISTEYFQEFSELLNLSFSKCQKSWEIIKDWSEKNHDFIFKHNKTLFSKSLNDFITTNQFKEIYDSEIIDELHTRGLEAQAKKGPRDINSIPGIFRNNCLIAFREIGKNLPELTELKAENIPETIKTEFRELFQRTFNKQVTFNGGYLHYYKSSFKKASEGILDKTAINEYSNYDCWLMKNKIYFQFNLIYQTWDKIPELFKNKEFFENVGIEMKLFKKTILSYEGVDKEVYEVL